MRISAISTMIMLSKSTQILTVYNSTDFLNIPFQQQINAICWQRDIMGDFSEIVQKIKSDKNMITLNIADLMELDLSDEGVKARDIIIEDIKMLEQRGSDPVLNLINNYERDENDIFPTDVYSFHVDRSPIPTDTILCTYYGAASNILPNNAAIQKIQIPFIRTELKKIFEGSEDSFEDFLTENFYDLHYEAKSGTDPINLGRGHLWRLAVDYPESPVLACIHRAPEEKGDKRLLLIC